MNQIKLRKKNKLLNLTKIFIFIMLISLVITSFNGVEARSSKKRAELKEWEILVALRKNGDIDILEKWDAEYSNISTLQRAFGEKINANNIKNIKVYEIRDGVPVYLERTIVKDKQEEGKYHFGKYKGVYEIGIGTKRGSNKTGEYYMSYTLSGGVEKYKDISQLYYVPISKSNKLKAKNLRIQFVGGDFAGEDAKLEDIKTDEKNFFVNYNPKKGMNVNVSFDQPTAPEINISDFETGVGVEFRYIFDSKLIKDVPYTNENENAKDRIIKEQENITKQIEEENNKIAKGKQIEEKLKKVLIYMIIPVELILVLIAIYLRRKRINRYKLETASVKEFEYFTDIPNETKLNILKISVFSDNLTTYKEAYAASFLKLIYLKIIKIEDDLKREKKIIGLFSKKEENKEYYKKFVINKEKYEELREDKTKITELEIKLMDILINSDINEDSEVTEEEFKNELKKSKYQNIVLEYNSSLEELKNRLKEEEYIRTKIGINIPFNISMVLASLITVIAAIILNSMIYVDIFILAFGYVWIFMVPMAINSVESSIEKYTEKGLQVYYEVKGLNKHLVDFSMINELNETSLIKWQEYLIYATALGISELVLKNIKEKLPEINQEIFDENSISFTDMMLISSVFMNDFSEGTISSYGNTGSSFSAGGFRWWRWRI